MGQACYLFILLSLLLEIMQECCMYLKTLKTMLFLDRWPILSDELKTWPRNLSICISIYSQHSCDLVSLLLEIIREHCVYFETLETELFWTHDTWSILGDELGTRPDHLSICISICFQHSCELPTRI